MAIEVILLNDVEGLGGQGDVVRVSDGYARNYLLPRNLATLMTESARKRIDKLLAERAVREAAAETEARAVAARMEQANVSVTVKTGEEGKLFGSVTAAQILETLQAQGFTLGRHAVELEHPIRELGTHTVAVRVHPKVTASVKVAVVGE